MIAKDHRRNLEPLHATDGTGAHHDKYQVMTDVPLVVRREYTLTSERLGALPKGTLVAL